MKPSDQILVFSDALLHSHKNDLKLKVAVELYAHFYKSIIHNYIKISNKILLLIISN